MTDSTKPLSMEDSIEAAEYALGVMQGQSRLQFERRLQHEPRLADSVRQWNENLAGFAEEIAPVVPPPRIRVALERDLFAVEPPGSRPSVWNSLQFWRGLAFASLIAMLALVSWTLYPATIAPGSGLVAQVTGQTNAVTLIAYYDESRGELRLNRTQGMPASGRSFELWLIAGKDAPISLGVLSEAVNGKVIVPAGLRNKIRGGVLAISDEPLGGSPTGAPTGSVLATGALTAV